MSLRDIGNANLCHDVLNFFFFAKGVGAFRWREKLITAVLISTSLL